MKFTIRELTDILVSLDNYVRECDEHESRAEADFPRDYWAEVGAHARLTRIKVSDNLGALTSGDTR